MSAPEVTAAARRESVVDAPPTPPKERRVGRPKKTTRLDPPGKSTPGPAPRGPGRPPGARSSKAALAPKIQELIGTGGLLVSAAGLARGDQTLMYDGERILAGAERLAVALDKAAAESPALRRTLELLIVSSVWGELATAAAAVVLPILAAHGVVPEMAAAVVGAPAPPARPDRSSAPDSAEPGGNGIGSWNPLDFSAFTAPDFPPGSAGDDHPSDAAP